MAYIDGVQIEGEVRGLRDQETLQLTEHVISRTVNLYDSSTKEVGQISQTGTVVPTGFASVRASDFIPVEPGETYKAAFCTSTAVSSQQRVLYYAFYNSAKEFIAPRIEGAATFTVPYGASYVRFSCNQTYADGMVLTKLSEFPTSFIPYAQFSDEFVEEVESLANRLPEGAIKVATEAELTTAVGTDGNTIVLANDITLAGTLTITHSVNIYGNDHTINCGYVSGTTAGIQVQDCCVRMYNLTVWNGKGCVVRAGFSGTVSDTQVTYGGMMIAKNCHIWHGDDVVEVHGYGVGVFVDCDIHTTNSTRTPGKSGGSTYDAVNVHQYGRVYLNRCKIHEAYDEGISTHDHSYAEVINTEAYNCGYLISFNSSYVALAQKGAYSSYGGIHLGGTGMGIVKGCYSHDNATYGIGLYCLDPEHSTGKAICVGNVVKKNGFVNNVAGDADKTGGIIVYGARDLELRSNTAIENANYGIRFGVDPTGASYTSHPASSGFYAENLILNNGIDTGNKVKIDAGADGGLHEGTNLREGLEKVLTSISSSGLEYPYAFLRDDKTLTVEGAAADAKVTGDRLAASAADVDDVKSAFDAMMPIKYANIANTISFSAYNGFPYSQDYYDEAKTVDSASCTSGKTNFGFYWDIPVTNGHKYLVMVKGKIVNAGDNTAAFAIGKQSGSSAYDRVSATFPTIGGKVYTVSTKTTATVDGWGQLIGLIQASANETVRIRGYFYPSANYDSVYQYKDIMIVDITDCYTADAIADIISKGYFRTDVRSAPNEAQVYAIEDSVKVLQEKNKGIAFTMDDLIAVANDSSYASVSSNVIAVSPNGDNTANMYVDIPVEEVSILSVSLIAKSSNITHNANAIYNSYLRVFGYDSAMSRIYISGDYPIVATDYRSYEYHIPIPLGVKTARLIFCGVSGVTFTIKEFMATNIQSVPQRINPGISFDAHLGNIAAPQDTLEGFLLARKAGFSSLIFNFRTTSDGVLVCLHDDEIGAVSTGTGKCSEMTYAQLSQYDFGFMNNKSQSPDYSQNITTGDGLWHKKNKYYVCKVPTLDECLKLCAITGMTPVFRLMESLSSASIATIKNMLMKYNLYGHARCKGFEHSLLNQMWESIGEGFVGYGIEFTGASFADSDVDTMIAKPYFNNNSFIECGYSYMNDTRIAYALSHGLHVGVGSIGSFSAIYDLIQRGVSYVTSDFGDGNPILF